MDGAAFGALPVDDWISGRIGPNSVIQLRNAVSDGLGQGAVERLFRNAGQADMLGTPPEDMIDERVPAALFRTLWDLYPVAAPALAAEAGRLTADYVVANRIPGIAQTVLRLAPRRLAARLLLQAIAKNAWTFAGSGRCEVTSRAPFLISITDNPLAMPDCVWHAAVFERLFERLVAGGTQVWHCTCCRQGARACRFEIDLPTP